MSLLARYVRIAIGCAVAMGVIGSASGRARAQEEHDWAPPSLTPAKAQRAERLARDLGHADWPTREQAQAELAEMGPDVRPLLERLVRDTSDEEARNRAGAALRRIELVRLSGPSFISMRLKDATPREVFAELGRQAGASISPMPANLWDLREFPPMDIEVEHQPFWEVFRDACRHFRVVPQSNQGELTLVEADESTRAFFESPAVMSGPFLVLATRITVNNTTDLAATPPVVFRNAAIQFTIYGEPKLRVLHWSSQAQLLTIDDAQGNSLIRPGRRSNDNFVPNAQGAAVWNVGGSFQPGEETGQTVALLRGSVRFLLQTRVETAQFDDVLENVGQTRAIGGRPVTLAEASRADGGYVVRMSFSRAGWNPFELNQVASTNQMRLVDANGVTLRRTRQAPERHAPDAIDLGITYMPPAGSGIAEPLKLVWELPVESREVEALFEFVDLPLP